jgi:CheY-like chemotaxis protein
MHRSASWLLDDDPTNIELLRVRLSAQGYEVVTRMLRDLIPWP